MGITDIGDALPEDQKETYLTEPLTAEQQEERKATQEEQREAARQEHNARTGGREVDPDAREQQRQEHNERVAHDS